jgi:hypothetical protein
VYDCESGTQLAALREVAEELHLYVLETGECGSGGRSHERILVERRTTRETLTGSDCLLTLR